MQQWPGYSGEDKGVYIRLRDGGDGQRISRRLFANRVATQVTKHLEKISVRTRLDRDTVGKSLCLSFLLFRNILPPMRSGLCPKERRRMITCTCTMFRLLLRHQGILCS